MLRRPPRSTLTDTLFPSTTLFRSIADAYSQMYRYIEASQENLEHANRASEQAVALDPGSAEAHASRGLALAISERYGDARLEFERAIDLDPRSEERRVGKECVSTCRSRWATYT